MDDMENTKKTGGLFSEFPPVSTQQWEEKIIQDLKGADYDKKLIWNTEEGFKVKPYYRAEDLEKINGLLSSLPGSYPFIRGAKSESNNWLIAQNIETSDISKANFLIKDATSRGADAVLINASEIKTGSDVKALLNGVDLEKVTLLFNSAPSYENLFTDIEEAITASGFDISKVKGVFDFDPLSYVLINGNFYNSEEGDLLEGAQLIKDAQQILPGFKVLSVNGQFFHNAGSTLVQELAFSLAAGNEYLSWYTSKGFNVDEVASQMTFVFATGGNYFMEIAKLRAARLLWARIVNEYKPGKIESAAMFIHSMTANWNKSIYDPYVNMLRTTTEAMSAALGKADIISVLPFNMNYQEPDDFSLRISRNQQIILKEESSLDKVVDPSAGSYYIESLTASLAEHGWQLFLKIEEMGGMLQAMKLGFIQDTITATAKEKKDAVANRRTLVLGTNQHPNLNENMLEKLQAETEEESDDFEEEIIKEHKFKTIEIGRAVDEFEDLRLATEIWENEGNKRPVVFMYTFGNLAMRKARAAFSTGFFGSAGYKIIDNLGFASIEDGLKAIGESQADIVVLCSSDEEYAELAADYTTKIKEAYPNAIVVVAGYPKELLDTLKAAGVDEFIHVRSNLLNTLYDFQRKLEIML